MSTNGQPASLKFENGILAQLSTALQVRLENTMRIFGSEGNIFLPNPWLAIEGQKKSTIYVSRRRAQPLEFSVEPERGLYALGADALLGQIWRPRQFPGMPWEDSLGNMRTLDRWREEIGLSYPPHHI